MKKVISTEDRPIKLWLNDIEEGALAQAKNLANHPFVHRHVAIMPDSHQGYGMPIGGVIGTKGVVIPNAVGVDIGCGVLAAKTTLKDITLEEIKKIFGGSKEFQGGIRSAIPTGKKHNSSKCQVRDMPYLPDLPNGYPIVYQQFEKARYQLGTLGGGNHFIEIQKGSDGHIWIMIHSGSRNLGYRVANHYNKVAVDLNEKWASAVPKTHQLAFLPLDTVESYRYMAEMEYCVKFADYNRKYMYSKIRTAFQLVLPNMGFIKSISVPHNYAAMENHFGQNLMIHRKGATRAYKNQCGIIPGSQGTHSYIVIGKGNVDSFMSCSHGAGRLMSRTAAKNTLDLETEQAKLKGILHSVKSASQLDEAPGSYKNIDDVMLNQTDLIETFVELTPLAVIKG